jgi:hypothetical protein
MPAAVRRSILPIGLGRMRACSSFGMGVTSCPLGIGGFFFSTGETTFNAIGEPYAQLIVGPPHHMAGVPIAKRRPEAEFVRDGICSHAR